jgi:hypothetical protein
MTASWFHSAIRTLCLASSVMATATGTAGFATPVAYFDCQLPSPQGPRVAKLAMDEDGKQVIYQLPSQHLTQRLPAVFTSDEVTFVVKDKSGDNTFLINRLTLSVQRSSHNSPDDTKTLNGSCSVTTGP